MHYEMLITSAGGSSSTWLMEELSKTMEVNSGHGAWQLKHGLPEIAASEGTWDKVLYLYINPMYSVLSHFRRKWVELALEYIGSPAQYGEIFSNFDRYQRAAIEAGEELFGVQHHFDRWAEYTEKPIYFLHMENPTFEGLEDFAGKEVMIGEFNRDFGKYDKCITPEFRHLYATIHAKNLIEIEALNQGLQGS